MCGAPGRAMRAAESGLGGGGHGGKLILHSAICNLYSYILPMGPLSLTDLLLRAAAVVVLVAANAFFVASEFALVAARRSRIAAMIRKGDRKARAVP